MAELGPYGSCKDCGVRVVWPLGGQNQTLPPHDFTGDVTILHGRHLVRGTLLTGRHVCDPTTVEAYQQQRAIEKEQWTQAAAAARAVRDPIKAAAMLLACSKCDAAPEAHCANLTERRGGREVPTVTVHRERAVAAGWPDDQPW